MMRKSFISYIDDTKKLNINNKYNNYINKLDICLNNIPNIILYGPSACGKYTEALKIIKKYSKSNLRYEKKLVINSIKNEHIIKISDIHYEINMENLTCNAKIVFNDVYNNILDSIYINPNKNGIILCKNFHAIDKELLDIFYSYMQKIINNSIIVKFIILTENISFIPYNILQNSKILYYSKLSINNYLKLSNKNNKKFLINMQNNNIENLKKFLNSIDNINILKNYKLNKDNLYNNNFKKKTCDIIIDIIINKKIDYVNIRNKLYDILILNLNIYECIYYIIYKIIKKKYNNIDSLNFINNIFNKTCEFFKYYNNNYRPIYHLESYIYYLIKELHEKE